MVLEKKFEAPFNKRPRDGPLLKINEQLYVLVMVYKTNFLEKNQRPRKIKKKKTKQNK